MTAGLRNDLDLFSSLYPGVTQVLTKHSPQAEEPRIHSIKAPGILEPQSREARRDSTEVTKERNVRFLQYYLLCELPQAAKTGREIDSMR